MNAPEASPSHGVAPVQNLYYPVQARDWSAGPRFRYTPLLGNPAPPDLTDGEAE